MPDDSIEDDLSFLDEVVIDITEPTVEEEEENSAEFSEEYKESLRKQGFTDDQIARLEKAASSDNSSTKKDDTNQLSTKDKKVTPLSEEEEGLSTGILALICVLAFLIIVPCCIWILINICAKCCPNSGCGKRFNEWKANRALNDDQK